MAKRPKHSRWRRLPGVYRTGQEHAPDPNQEPQRISLYIPWESLDLAEAQAARLGFANAQDYCTDLLLKGLEADRVSGHVADVEAKRGPFEGLHQIADDPEYLADFRAATAPRPAAPRALPPPEIVYGDGAPAVRARVTTAPTADGPDGLSPSAWVVMRHAAQADQDPSAFIACLRRGEAVPPSEMAELAQALHALEVEYRDARVMDRRLTFALHRLAFESQILHTDAWPNAFDPWTVDMLRAVQEAVERTLSGQDIRYFEAAPPLSFQASIDGPDAETPR